MHAHDQRVAFDSTRSYPLTAWTHGAQKHLPDAISLRSAWEVEEGFSPRATSIDKSYIYRLLVDPQRDPFFMGRVWRVPELDRETALDVMRAEARVIVGCHDFAAFRGASDQRESTVRTLLDVSVDRSAVDARMIVVRVTGDGFLFNMVRIIVGALVDVGRGRKPIGTLARGLETKDRRDLGITAPPDGLYLDRYRLRGDEDRPFPHGI